MKITFNYIRNRIREHNKEDIVNACYKLLESYDKNLGPIWFVFILMKWTYLYGSENHHSKPLTNKKFSTLLKSISKFNDNHISQFIKDGKIDRAFHILYTQQFYLQTEVYPDIFTSQLKLFKSLGNNKINNTFKQLTKVDIYDFIYFMQLIWLYINIDKLKKEGFKYEGYLPPYLINLIAEIIGFDKVDNILKIMVLDPIFPASEIKSLKYTIRKEEYQSMERTFFTNFPLQIQNNKIRIIHLSVLKYSLNYYIYDFLKNNDPNFTTVFGIAFEKYINEGINYCYNKYYNENELKKILPKNSNIVDFYIPKENIYIECKAIESQNYASVNPTDEIIYNSLKDSIFKAYFKQLLKVSKKINPNKENWGIIITYKKLFWSQFSELYNLAKDKFENFNDIQHLPPENVFVIDIYTWDKIVYILHSKQSSLTKILKSAKEKNSSFNTKKQCFDMHLDEYDFTNFKLDYLTTERKLLEVKFKK
ncbi:hypothetical protein V1389_07460 [Flavobacterium rakeshii]|uniref:hypothetical protein n=1 Tax=Flavobacterium rakeshii TaxID=1038845 RepID=UPI002E7AD335|nr:hypothetical protein [Flavobacterium rakeshii]MEE1898166.1 hypothetical protein [Flavobacterium rakeshii]